MNSFKGNNNKVVNKNTAVFMQIYENIYLYFEMLLDVTFKQFMFN